jgi:major membrane immunogen (membrane-anchored lipoprotein)
MKRIFDLKHEEVIALKENDLNRFITMECMVLGAQLKSKPEEPQIEIPPPTLKVWKVAGLTFTEQEPAQAIFDIIQSSNSLIKTSRNYDYDLEIEDGKLSTSNYDYPHLESKLIYQNFTSEEVKQIFRKQKESLAKYKEELKEWDNYQLIKSQAVNSILSFLELHVRIDAAKKEYERIYNTYLEAADGNETVAKRFFDRNEKFTVDGRNVIPVIKGEETPESFVLNSPNIKMAVDYVDLL